MGSLGTVDMDGRPYVLVQLSNSFAGLCARDATGDGGLALASAFPVVAGVPRPGTSIPKPTKRAIWRAWQTPRSAAPVAASAPSRGRNDRPGRGAPPKSTQRPRNVLFVALPRGR